MTSRAPITCPDTLSQSLVKAGEDPDFGFLNIAIDFKSDAFVIKNYGKSGANIQETWSKILASCEKKTHAYFVTLDPVKSPLFLLIHFAPDTSPVRQRMLYASSRATLKAFLGNARFTADYFCSTEEELTVDALLKSRATGDIEVRSFEEISKAEAELESVPTSSSSQVMNNLPIEMRDTGKQAIASYINKQCKCVLLKLNPEDQSIEGSEHKCQSVAEIKPLLEATVPVFFLFWYSKGGGGGGQNSNSNSNNGNANANGTQLERIFGYYCPDKADRKLKFTYSTCKSSVIEYCNLSKLQFFAKIEMSGLADFTIDYLDYHIFPTVYKQQEKFAMPTAPGGKKRKKGGKKKKKLSANELISN